MHKISHPKQQYKKFIPERTFLLVVGLVGGVFLVFSYLQVTSSSRSGGGAWETKDPGEATSLQMEAIRYYATQHVVPQQSFDEITVSFDVLGSAAPCNFLVFGLGRDSLMWAALNPRGTTLFLEEDPQWVQTVLKDAPTLSAVTVKYTTQLSEADELLRHYQEEPHCSVHNSSLRHNHKCRLALNMLSDEVYDTEWDMIMVDAPRGYFPQAPGRMAAIYSAAVMARNRKKSGVTHVFVHDVNRKVERQYAERFLCKKYLVKAVGRLWHFEIPPATAITTATATTTTTTDSDFC
ncbi:arabinogalactan O-methyltransferase 1-like [Henckelia pumila]|uniref:arabinogalactan O-methyltransferase 1-like n=1 Tax=Henckelia pumila TaxID=405737 RepID=UPI003C6DEE18